MVLELYVSQGCSSCDSAQTVGHAVAEHFPQVELHVVDVDAPDVEVAEIVFAVPTFVLEGRIISLGTPDPDALSQAIRASLET